MRRFILCAVAVALVTGCGGGDSEDDVATGGASTGGASTGGASTGGASTGGASTGGASTGGAGELAAQVPEGFDSLCGELSTPCSLGTTAADVTNSYAGTGTTASTSNELWAVGESEDFTAQLDTTTPGKVSGVFDMGSFAIEVAGAQYSGEGDEFTIYGIDIVEDGDCNMEARVVIKGTRSASGTVLTGELGLEFTENISGTECEAEVISGYPGTGAVFTYTASLSTDAG